jgi:hypothetical protein
MRLLPFRRRSPDEPTEPWASARPTDPPGAVRFWTDLARRRFIPIQPTGDAVAFVAPRSRLWRGQDPGVFAHQVVNRATLPDTVTCGRGYIEVLEIADDGILVNEVRTHGDQVLAIPVWDPPTS